MLTNIHCQASIFSTPAMCKTTYLCGWSEHSLQEWILDYKFGKETVKNAYFHREIAVELHGVSESVFVQLLLKVQEEIHRLHIYF